MIYQAHLEVLDLFDEDIWEQINISWSNKIQFLQLLGQQMSRRPSLSSQLKPSSKDASSSRIDQLYREFEDLKVRIRSKSRPKQAASTQLLPSQPEPPSDIFDNCELQLVKKEHQDQIEQHKSYSHQRSNFQGKKENVRAHFKKQEGQPKQKVVELIKACYEAYIKQLQATVSKKISYLDSKLKVCDEMIRSVRAVLKMKKSLKHSESNPESKNNKLAYFYKDQHQEQAPVVDLIRDYERKIEDMEKLYQQKLRELDRDSSKDRQTSSTARNSLQSQINDFQSLLLAKDHEIGVLKLENSKLRRKNDQLLSSANFNLRFISDLKAKIVQLETKSSKTREISIQTDFSNYKQIYSMHLYVNKSEQAKNMVGDQSQQQSQISEKGSLEWRQNFEGHLEEFGITEPQEFLNRSQIFEPKRKTIKEQMLKDLRVEIELLAEENKNLQAKKHFLQSQNQAIEADEERFQQQSTIYKTEIRYLTGNLQALDYLTVALLTHKQLEVAKVDCLGDELRSKRLFKEKFLK